MKISVWIPAIVLCALGIVMSNSIDVGTVLFTTTDLVKRCWIDSDKSLLRARLMMQDVLPDPDYIDFSKPDIVMTLLDYFHSCYEIIRTTTCGNIQSLMLLALSDTLGGYLRAYVLPLTRRAYYAGQMNYSEAKKLFQMYDDIKGYLKTNGIGWTEPQYNLGQVFYPKPLVINEKGGKAACDSLYTIEKRSTKIKSKILNMFSARNRVCKAHKKKKTKPHSKERHRKKGSKKVSTKKKPVLVQDQAKKNMTQTSSKNLEQRPKGTEREDGDLKQRLKEYYEWTTNNKEVINRSVKSSWMGNRTETGNPVTWKKVRRRKRRWGCRRNDGKFEGGESPAPTKVVIPLPLLDDPDKPHAIAVPFRAQPLRNLNTQNSAFVLEHYYSSAIKCLFNQRTSRRDIHDFNEEFYAWLVSEVCPHLGDEKWYPAFGGVLRILETIKKFGTDSDISNFTNVPQDGNSLVENVKMNEKRKIETQNGKSKEKIIDLNDKEEEEEGKTTKQPSRYFMFAVLVVAVLGIMLLSSCIFYVYQVIKTMTSPSKKEPPPSKRKPNDLKFEFLVQFFKKRDKPTETEEVSESEMSRDRYGARYLETKRHDIWVGRTDVPKSRLWGKDKPAKDDQNERKDKKKADTKHKGQLVALGQGDAPAFISQVPQLDFSSLAKQLWSGRGSLARAEKQGAPGVENAGGDGGGKKSKPAKELDNKVETLWKIPSSKFARGAKREDYTSDSKTKDSLESSGTGKRNTGSDSLTASAEDGKKDDSSEKRSSSYGYSGSCSQSRVTTTCSSSQTQVEDKISSATMEFFEKVIAKHKPFAKSSTQETTAESETDGSYSSETDY